MYERFYGLKQKPFEISPNPAFFYPTPRHNEALANLCYGISRRKGFIVMTGEVGTGKTLLLSCLVDLLKSTQATCAFITNTRLMADEFLWYIMADLEVLTRARDKGELLLEFRKYLIDRYRRGLTTVLIVDEAHLLGLDVLEEIRLLGNLETPEDKLLQIVLAGQAELDDKIDSAPLRQLKQRVMLRCRLEPLRKCEIDPYIERRLSLAGAAADAITFSDRAIELIYEYSTGIPRIVNMICENALVIGCAQQVRTISPLIVEEVASDFHLNRSNHFTEDAEYESKFRQESARAGVGLS